jgi:hypothetical protein
LTLSISVVAVLLCARTIRHRLPFRGPPPLTMVNGADHIHPVFSSFMLSMPLFIGRQVPQCGVDVQDRGGTEEAVIQAGNSLVAAILVHICRMVKGKQHAIVDRAGHVSNPP